MVPAVYVGHHGRSGALMALTEHGTVKARSFRKLPEAERYLASELKKLKGLPWALNQGYDPLKEKVPLVAGDMATGIPIMPVPLVGRFSCDADGCG